MDIWTILRTSLRRWYAFVPILALALGLGYSMAQDLDPVYTAESTAILVAPSIVPGQEEGEKVEVNPYMSLGGGLTATTQVIVVLMDSGPKRLEYFERGLEPDYVVDRNDAVMSFAVTGDEPDSVIETANELVDIADTEVAALQEKASVIPEERIRVRPLSLPAIAQEDGSAGPQLLAILGVLGLVAGIGGAIALDGFIRWRKRHRSTARTPSGGSHDPDRSSRSGRPGIRPPSIGRSRPAKAGAQSPSDSAVAARR